MSVYKYVSAEGALRYLDTWALRVTPPDVFNDPFEMRPTVEYGFDDVIDQVPDVLRKQLSEILGELLTGEDPSISRDEVEIAVLRFVNLFLGDLDLAALSALAARGIDPKPILALRGELSATIAQVTMDARSRVPDFQSMAQQVLHSAIPKALGVLCLSASARHPLMWAHYSDSHRGALLEFDERHVCFNRQGKAPNHLGRLRRVHYSDSRPILGDDHGGEADEFVLTKALEWAYEQEFRMVVPLQSVDRTIEDERAGSIHLIDVPAEALRSITLGCRASSTFESDVIAAIAAAAVQRPIGLRKATIHNCTFPLNYG